MSDPEVLSLVLDHGCQIATMETGCETTTERETTQMRKQRGFSLIELLIVVAIILIIAAIAIPNLLRSRIAANESSAVGSLRTLNTAEVTYASTYPDVGYATSFTQLGPATGTPTSATAGLLDNVLACGAGPCKKSGYSFSLGVDGAAPPKGYIATAVPGSINTSGVKSFCSSADAVIHSDPTGGAIADSKACDTLNAIQ